MNKNKEETKDGYMKIKKISIIIAIGMATLFAVPTISSFAENINTNNTSINQPLTATGTIQFTDWNYTDVTSNSTWYSNVIGSLNNGTSIQIVGQTNNWYEINFNGSTGWVPKSRVNVNRINNGDINFPSVGYTDVTNSDTWYSNVDGTISDGTQVGIVGQANGWDEIEYNNQIVWTPQNRVNETGSIMKTGVVNFELGYTDVMQLGTWYSNCLGTLNNGTNINIIGESNSWYEIQYNGGTAWIPKARVSFNQIQAMSVTKTVDFNQLSYTDITSEGTWYSNVVGTLNNGTNIDVIGQNANWYEIQYDGGTAWIPKTRVTSPENWSQQQEQNNQQTIKNIISEGEQFIGTPYVWGGESPSGFDCSGLMQYIFENNGVSLPRTTEQQQQCGTPVAQGNLKAGDLVFWGYPAYHVAMYIGNGKILVSPHTGTDVQIMNLYPYTDARRIIN